MLKKLSSKKKKDPVKQAFAQFLEFLENPIWSIPISSFIEQKSVVFERVNGELNMKVYKDIHSEFAGLVETLVDCFCGDTGTSAETLQEGLAHIDQHNLTLKQRTSLEPVAAANDFEIFVPMMMRKNVELQLQALQMIEFMCGLIPNALQLEEGESLKNKKVLTPEETERYVLISVLRQSKEEFDSKSESELKKDFELIALAGEEERKRLEMERDREAGYFRAEHRQDSVEVIPKDVIDSAVRPSRENTFDEETDVKQTSSGTVQHEEKEQKTSETKNGPTRKTSEAAIPAKPQTAAASIPACRASASTTERSASAKRRPLTAKRSEDQSIRPSAVVKELADRPTTSKRKNSSSEANDDKKESNLRRPASKGLKDVTKPSIRMAPQTSSAPGAGADAEAFEGAEQGPRSKMLGDVHALLQDSHGLSPEEIARRKSYLEGQRDKLLKMKQEERRKQFQEITERSNMERPRTAKAARGAMRGVAEDDLTRRKALMEKIKNEVGESSP